MGALLGSILGAAGPIIGGIEGLFGGNKAAKNIATGNINAEHGVLGATGAAQNDIQSALYNAGTPLYDTALAGTQPYQQAGNQGLAGLSRYAGSNPQFSFTPSQYFNSPAYQFQLQQGQNAILNNASTSGFGGNTLRDLTQYGQGLAANYYNQAFNQAQNTFQTNQNATLANLDALIKAGEFGTAQQSTLANQAANFYLGGNEALGQTGIQGAQVAGNYAVGAGNAQGGGALNAGNQYSSILGGLGSLIGGLQGRPNGYAPVTGGIGDTSGLGGIVYNPGIGLTGPLGSPYGFGGSQGGL